MEHKEFKPFDKVLVRFGKNGVWFACLYSHWDKDCNEHYTFSGLANDNDILPFEGNEELLDKVGEPAPKRWRAEYGYPYWFIGVNSGVLAIFTITECNMCNDDNHYADNNYFRTEEQAKEKLEQIKQILRNEQRI